MVLINSKLWMEVHEDLLFIFGCCLRLNVVITRKIPVKPCLIPG